jgi:hypothetical protein
LAILGAGLRRYATAPGHWATTKHHIRSTYHVRGSDCSDSSLAARRAEMQTSTVVYFGVHVVEDHHAVGSMLRPEAYWRAIASAYFASSYPRLLADVRSASGPKQF